MDHLKLGYLDIQSMPWEYFDWIYRRHMQYLIDEEQKRNEQYNMFG